MSCSGYQIKGIIGARATSNIVDEDNELSASSYVQDGLISIWDGIENVAPGEHADDPIAWVDIVGGRFLYLDNNAYFSLDGVCNKSEGLPVSSRNYPAFAQMPDTSFFSTLIEIGEVTIEICENATSEESYYIWSSPLIAYSAGNPQSALYAQQYYNRFLGRGLFDFSISPVFNKHTLDILIDKDNGDGFIYMNGLFNKKFVPGSENGQSAINTKFGIINKIHCIRIYNRTLSQDEIEHNYLVDKERFGI